MKPKVFMNFTGMPIRLRVGPDEEQHEYFECCGAEARVEIIETPYTELIKTRGTRDGYITRRVPCIRQRYGIITGLPNPGQFGDDVVFIVSPQVLARCGAERPDLVAPDYGHHSAIRDEHGQIIAVRRFVKWVE